MLVTLTDEEVEFAAGVAVQRGEPKESYDSTRRWTDNYHFYGVLGELAYAKHYRVDMDCRVFVDGDGGADLVILGYEVDVKTTNYDPPILKLNSCKDFKADLLALAYRESDTKIHLFGFTNLRNMIMNGFSRDFGNGPRWCLAHENLTF